MQEGECSMESKADALMGCKNTSTTNFRGALAAGHTA